MIAGRLPHHPRLSGLGAKILHEQIEIGPVTTRRRISYALPIWRKATEVVYSVGGLRQLPFLAVPEQKELSTLVAADVHAEDEPLLLRGVTDARDPFLVKSELLRPAAPHRYLPRLRNAGDVGQEGDLASIWRPGGSIGGPNLKVASEFVGQEPSSLALERRLKHKDRHAGCRATLGRSPAGTASQFSGTSRFAASHASV